MIPTTPPTLGKLLPLCDIPEKAGFLIIGVRGDGAEARLTVYFDRHAGVHKVPGLSKLVGWRMP